MDIRNTILNCVFQTEIIFKSITKRTQYHTYIQFNLNDQLNATLYKTLSDTALINGRLRSPNNGQCHVSQPVHGVHGSIAQQTETDYRVQLLEKGNIKFPPNLNIIWGTVEELNNSSIFNAFSSR